jgi:hypothetical protein
LLNHILFLDCVKLLLYGDTLELDSDTFLLLGKMLLTSKQTPGKDNDTFN